MHITAFTHTMSAAVVAAAVAVAGLFAASCSDPASDSQRQEFLAIGTWGGDDAGVIVGEDNTHVHIGCTLGDMPAEIPLDNEGRFTIGGSYVLRAFPVVVGPPLPAVFSGQVHGNALTLTVTVDDTVSNETVDLGPVLLTYGEEPTMGPCPICRNPTPNP